MINPVAKNITVFRVANTDLDIFFLEHILHIIAIIFIDIPKGAHKIAIFPNPPI